jgi:hypothetical protein
MARSVGAANTLTTAEAARTREEKETMMTAEEWAWTFRILGGGLNRQLKRQKRARRLDYISFRCHNQPLTLISINHRLGKYVWAALHVITDVISPKEGKQIEVLFEIHQC